MHETEQHVTEPDQRSSDWAGKAQPFAIVLYDGVCVFCNRTVRFLIKRDKKDLLTFAPLQGATAKRVLKDRELEIAGDVQSVVFVRDAGKAGEEVFVRSTAILRIFETLGGIWRLVLWLRLIPRALRDLVYRWVASNRYEWFGKYSDCPVPPKAWRDKFLP